MGVRWVFSPDPGGSGGGRRRGRSSSAIRSASPGPERAEQELIGRRSLAAGTPILVLAGPPADSQAMAGAGTPGEAVDIHGAAPMNPAIADELHWNLPDR